MDQSPQRVMVASAADGGGKEEQNVTRQGCRGAPPSKGSRKGRSLSLSVPGRCRGKRKTSSSSDTARGLYGVDATIPPTCRFQGPQRGRADKPCCRSAASRTHWRNRSRHVNRASAPQSRQSLRRAMLTEQHAAIVSELVTCVRPSRPVSSASYTDDKT